MAQLVFKTSEPWQPHGGQVRLLCRSVLAAKSGSAFDVHASNYGASVRFYEIICFHARSREQVDAILCKRRTVKALPVCSERCFLSRV